MPVEQPKKDETLVRERRGVSGERRTITVERDEVAVPQHVHDPLFDANCLPIAPIELRPGPDRTRYTRYG